MPLFQVLIITNDFFLFSTCVQYAGIDIHNQKSRVRSLLLSKNDPNKINKICTYHHYKFNTILIDEKWYHISLVDLISANYICSSSTSQLINYFFMNICDFVHLVMIAFAFYSFVKQFLVSIDIYNVLYVTFKIELNNSTNVLSKTLQDIIKCCSKPQVYIYLQFIFHDLAKHSFRSKSR